MRIVTIPVADKYDFLAPNYDDHFCAVRYAEQWDGQVVTDRLGDVRGKSVLDIGCGTGRLLARLRDLGANTLGIDISRSMVEVARARGLRVFQYDIREFEWQQPFDAIVSVSVFNYIEDKASVLKRVWSLLRPGGVFVLSMEAARPRDTAVPRADHAVASPYYALTKDAYSTLLSRSSLLIEDSADLFYFPEFVGGDDPEQPIGFILKARKPATAKRIPLL